MAATSSVLMAASLAATALSTGIGVYSSIQQGKAQAAQAKAAENQARYQSEVARRNADMAEQQASAQRMQGFEAAQAERLKTARLIGRQRAQAGASGVAVDSGSFEDVAEDTASAGEFDAINAYNSGIDKAYNTEIQAWNYNNQAAGYDAQADSYGMQASAAGPTSTLNAIGSGIGGIANIGSTWAQFDAKYGDHTSGPKFTSNYNKMDIGRFGRG